MADRYLKTYDDGGRDSNDGSTHALAWASWDHAHATIGDGEICDVDDGIYRESTGVFDYWRPTRAFTSETIFRAATPHSTGVIITTSGSGTPTNNAHFVRTDNLTLIDITFRVTQSNPTANVQVSGATTDFKMIRCAMLMGEQTQDCGAFWKISAAGNGSVYRLIDCKFEASGGSKTGIYFIGASGNLVDDVIVRGCRGWGGGYGLRARYISNLKVYNSSFTGTTGGEGIKCGNDDAAVDEGMDGLEIRNTFAENLLLANRALFLGGGCNNSIIDGCWFKGGANCVWDGSDGATFRSCVFVNNTFSGVIRNVNLNKTNTRVGTPSVYDNCSIIGWAGQHYGIQAIQEGALQATKVTFTNCAAWAHEVFGPDTEDNWGTTLFTNGVYGPRPGNNPPAITNSVNVIPEIDALLIPVVGGNCDIGKGVVGKRTLGQLDCYGRPVLRADADAIGAVYPQRADRRNILKPIVQYASEAA